MQGMGVKTPKAAMVAAKVGGYAKEAQTPKGIIFKRGMLSNIFAIGKAEDNTILAGRTLKTEGAAPKGHWQTPVKAPLQVIQISLKAISGAELHNV